MMSCSHMKLSLTIRSTEGYRPLLKQKNCSRLRFGTDTMLRFAVTGSSGNWYNSTKIINDSLLSYLQAFKNLRKPTPANGFVSDFIDTAFNGCIFMWDSAFILMFAKYARQIFHFQGTLDNFYGKQHADGFICREIRQSGKKIACYDYIIDTNLK